jgi:hypothetical protein
MAYPTLTALLGPQLAEMERVCAMGQSGKYAGKRPEERDEAFHLSKAHGHVNSAGFERRGDLETRAPHVLLAAIRLMMADASAKGAK